MDSPSENPYPRPKIPLSLPTEAPLSESPYHPLRLLIVDDSEYDASLLLYELRQGGYTVTHQRVDTPTAMRAALEHEQWDVITSDHSMPAFSAPAALKLAQELCPDVPFIIVSGEIDLNLVVSLMKAGAHDYIQKHELPRVVPSIQRELKEVELHHKQRQAEEERRISEEKFYKAFHNSPDAINLNRLSDGVYLAVNAGFERVGGYSAAEVLGHSTLEINIWPDPAIRDQLSKKLLRDGVLNNEETLARAKDGSLFPVLLSARLITVNGEQCVLAFTRDMSEQKRAEEEIRSQNRELQAVSQIITAAITQLDITQILKEALSGAVNLIGLESGAVYLLDPAEQNLSLAAIYQLSSEQETFLRAHPIPRDGLLCEGLILTQKPLIWGIEPHPNFPDILPDKNLQFQVLFPLLVKNRLTGMLYIIASQTPDLVRLNSVELTQQMCGAVALALENAHLYKAAQAYADDLEQRVAERTTQLSAINQELETFSYSVAHDLRAPLRSVSGYIGIFMEEYGTQIAPGAHRLLENISASNKKMGLLINALLDFSRLNRKLLAKTDLNMNELARDVLGAFTQETKERQIEWVLGEMPPAHADPILIRQVFANLISNAIKYTRKCTQARIEIGSVEQNGVTAYYVRDNGVGFDMKYADKLFGVFQRLHSESEFEGNGIGLAIVQRIIARHEGHIWAEAEPDKGAAFHFTLD
jgi:PAS domain S-box-containing protein